MIRLLLGIGLIGLLTGCSSEPSEADLKAVVQTQYDSLNGLGNMFGMKQGIASLKSVEKVTCNGIREKVYRCDLVVFGTNPITGDDKRVVSLLLMKTKDGWVELEE